MEKIIEQLKNPMFVMLLLDALGEMQHCMKDQRHAMIHFAVVELQKILKELQNQTKETKEQGGHA